MRTTVHILILVLVSNILFGQSYSFSVDSLTKSYIRTLPKENQNKFDKILIQRQLSDLKKRIDTLKFDFAFIEESYCYVENEGNVTESYFENNDSIPKYIYINGKLVDPKTIYKELSIWISKTEKLSYNSQNLKNVYSKLKPTQDLNYNKIQVLELGCISTKNEKTDFRKDTKEELKQTYQVQTMIDSDDKKILVSVQTAPKRPKFKIHSIYVW